MALLLVTISARCWAAEDWKPVEAQLPPPGIEISAAEKQALTKDLEQLQARLQQFDTTLPGYALHDLRADVEIFTKAVRLAIAGNEFYHARDVQTARELLATAKERLDALAAGKPAWTDSRGLVVRGYRSRIDNSVQPYGLVIPDKLDLRRPGPLYVWLHGRDDKLTDLNFIDQRQKQVGQVKIDDAIVLHPFGRSCLGWKSAAEIDVLEAIGSVFWRYKIDLDRVVLMGFSMGGAGAWHLGAHYAPHWVGVHAGAGFVDVKRYQRLTPDKYPPEYEQALWGMYDVPDYVRNLFNLPIVAYSGELDKQKDAADFMAEAFQREGKSLTHLVGPGMGHKYEPTVWNDVLGRMRAVAAARRNPYPPQIYLQTRTLRYNRMDWVEALGLGQHWRDARIDATVRPDGELVVDTRNITALRLSPAKRPTALTLDGQTLAPADPPMSFQRSGGMWLPAIESEELQKIPGLQGPIDDVFLEHFLVVTPSGQSGKAVERWVRFELDHFLTRWRRVYRGEPRVKRDVDVTAIDVDQFHIVAWGDPSSNSLLRRAADKLPVQWSGEMLHVGRQAFAGQSHLPLLIYPNPLNPAKYLVLNSGPTHREAHDRTNSLQNPKLPDWAVVDITVAPDAERPGRVVAADFFDEQWQLRPAAAHSSSPAAR